MQLNPKRLALGFAMWSIVGMLAVAALSLTAGPVLANGVCADGNGWTKIDSDDLSLHPVEGATEYCFKAGSWEPVSSIPEGGFGQEGSCNEGIQFCELSHWAYFIPEEEPEVELIVNCRGWRVKQGDEILEQGEWTDPFTLEVQFSEVLDQRVREPEECLVTLSLEVNCEGWGVFRSDQGGPVETGTWTDPFELEVQFSEVLDQRIREPEECLLQPGQVNVDPTIACDRAAGDGVVYQAIVFLVINPTDGAILTFDGNDYTESQPVYVPFGSYDWSAVAADGFTIVGGSTGKVSISNDDCNPVKPPPTGGPGDLLTEEQMLVGIGAVGLAAVGAGAYGLWRRKRVAA